MMTAEEFAALYILTVASSLQKYTQQTTPGMKAQSVEETFDRMRIEGYVVVRQEDAGSPC